MTTSDVSLLALIGNTPIHRVSSLDTGVCELFLKLENRNPGGSIKDRVGLSMISAAEQQGKLRPGDTIIEATAGNTGLGLALVAGRKGYRLVLVIPDKMSREKVSHLRALGAEVVITRSDVGKGHPEYYQDVAARLAREHGYYYVNQFENPANPLAHETTTGPEIWEQLDGRLDALVCGVGSGGTLTGLRRFFSRVAPKVEFVVADPVGSVIAEYISTKRLGTAGSWLVEGIGEDFIPSICDLDGLSTAVTVSDAESFDTARTLLLREGILGGSSTGTLVAAALRYCRAQTSPKRVLTFVCDSGNKYLSKMYNDYWMADQGFSHDKPVGNLSDLILRKHASRSVIGVAPGDTLMRAHSLMRLYEVSQLAVLENDEIVGILDESDILLGVWADQSHFRDEVRTRMTKSLRTIPARASVRELLPIFEANMVAIVVDDESHFQGLITRIDMLNYLRRQYA